jgi:hypothetical protein
MAGQMLRQIRRFAFSGGGQARLVVTHGHNAVSSEGRAGLSGCSSPVERKGAPECAPQQFCKRPISGSIALADQCKVMSAWPAQPQPARAVPRSQRIIRRAKAGARGGAARAAPLVFSIFSQRASDQSIGMNGAVRLTSPW